MTINEPGPPNPASGNRDSVRTSNLSRNLILAATLLGFCFAGGFATGIIADRFMLLHQGRMLPHGGADFVTRHLAAHLSHRLNLSTTQKKRVQAILDRRKKELVDRWQIMQGQFHREIEATNDEIETILTPEQRKKFEEMQRQWRPRRR